MNSIEILDKILIKYKTLCSKFANASNFLSNTKGDSYYSIQKRNQKNPVQIRLSNHGTFLKTWIDREELSDSKTRLLDPSSCFNISIVFIDDNTNITTQCVGQNNCDNCTITPCQPQTFQGQNELGKPFTVKQYVYKSSSINSRNLNGIVKAIMEARFRGEYIDPLLTTAKRASQKELTSQPQQPIQENNNKQINTNKIVMKINESQLRKVIRESIQNVLTELDWKTYANAAWKEDMINNNWDDDNWKGDDSRARRFRQAAIDAFNREHGYQNGEEEYSMLYDRDETFDGITPAVYDAKYGEPNEYDTTKQTPSWEQNPERYTRGHMFDVYSTNGAESANHLKHKYYGNRKKNMFSPKDPIPKNYSADLKQAIINGNREISRYLKGDYQYVPNVGWQLKDKKV